MVEDLREVKNGNRLTVILESGEEFTGIVVDKDQDYADEYSKGFVSFAFEGDWWERVNDRVDSEVLHLAQNYKRVSGKPEEVTLHGTVWVGETEEASTPGYKSLGQVKSVEAHDD